jgi:hypothetical protein
MKTPAERAATRAAAERARRARKREAAAVAGRTPNELARGRAAGPAGWAWRGLASKGGISKTNQPKVATTVLDAPLCDRHFVLDGQGVALAEAVGIEHATRAARAHSHAVCVIGVDASGAPRLLARCGAGEVAAEAVCRRALERWRHAHDPSPSSEPLVDDAGPSSAGAGARGNSSRQLSARGSLDGDSPSASPPMTGRSPLDSRHEIGRAPVRSSVGSGAAGHAAE